MVRPENHDPPAKTGLRTVETAAGGTLARRVSGGSGSPPLMEARTNLQWDSNMKLNLNLMMTLKLNWPIVSR